MSGQGKWDVHAAAPPLAEAARELGRSLAADAARLAGPLSFAGMDAYAKGAPLGPSARRRHALARLVLRRSPPCLAEYRNLVWLRARLFRAPPPLAVATLWRGGLPRYQLLVTRAVEGAVPLDEYFARGGGGRAQLVDELAREVARMHALRFLHHDLFPRNILVDVERAPRRIVFLDAWAGGPAPNLRGPAYDLACLFLDGELFAPDQQRALLSRYLRERAHQERPADPQRLARGVDRARRALLAGQVGGPERLRGAPLADREWSARALLAEAEPLG